MFKKLLIVVALISLLGAEAWADGKRSSNRDTKQSVLVLYDNVGPYAITGKSYAMLLENLLGHFDVNIVAKPASSYVAGEMKRNIAAFYIGSTYGVLGYFAEGSKENAAYQAFYKDIATSNVPLVWMNYNLQYLEEAWNRNNWGSTSMAQKLGIKFQYTFPISYNRVKYKNTELYKGVVPFATPGSNLNACLSEGDNRYACALELTRIDIVDTNKTKVYATAYSSVDSTVKEAPYITKAGNFWFVGDIPFTYMSEEDRYLAFSDLLHDMTGILHKEEHLAIMRLEDVDARTELSDLTAIATLTKSKNVFFSVATIAQYEDPFGLENNGVATSQSLAGSKIGTYLKELYDQKRIAIVAHGYTHQAGNIQNPYNGLSGDDFEFMRVVENSDQSYSYLYPTWNDSGFYAWLRMYKAKRTLKSIGLKAFSWESPHYMAGPNHYRAIKELYPVQYARMLYYPSENSLDKTKKYNFIGQFFPYVIQKDIYGYTIIPENIHNIEDAPNAGYRQLTSADTVKFAQKLKVVRDGVASFYYHPYLGTSELGKIIDGLRQVGYTFTKAPALVKKDKKKKHGSKRHKRKR
jgi:uncharacterized protein YdaL